MHQDDWLVEPNKKLMNAAFRGDVERVAQLVKDGADVNSRDDLDRMPIHHAAMGGHIATIKELIRLGADINQTDRFGETPFKIATRRSHFEAEQFLKDSVIRSERAPTGRSR